MGYKPIITDGSKFQFYREHYTWNNPSYCEEDMILQIDQPCKFEANQHSVTLHIPVAVWEHIRKFAASSYEYADCSISQLREIATKRVDASIASHLMRLIQTAPVDGLIRGTGAAILLWDNHGQTRDQQIRKLFNQLKAMRTAERKLKQAVESLSKKDGKTTYSEDNELQKPLRKTYDYAALTDSEIRKIAIRAYNKELAEERKYLAHAKKYKKYHGRIESAESSIATIIREKAETIKRKIETLKERRATAIRYRDIIAQIITVETQHP